MWRLYRHLRALLVIFSPYSPCGSLLIKKPNRSRLGAVSVSVSLAGTYGGIIHSGNAAIFHIATKGAYYPNLIHGANVIIFRDIRKLSRHYFLIIFPLPFCMSLCHSDQDSSATPSRSRLGLSILPAPLSDGKSNFKGWHHSPSHLPIYRASRPFYPSKKSK